MLRENHDFLAWSAWRRRRRIIDHIRKAAHETEKVEKFAHGQPHNPASADLEERLVAEKLLADAIRKLPETQRAAVQLRYRYELSHREIADLLGMNPNSLGSLLDRAKKNLKKIMEPDKKGGNFR